MDERAKDRTEDVVAAVVEASAALIPLVGGALAVGVNRAYGSARQRRFEFIVRSLSERLDAHVSSGKIVDLAGVLGDDDVVAQVERVVRASRETTSIDKITMLIDALTGGIVLGWTDERHRLMVLAERLDPIHVQILGKVEGAIAEVRAFLPQPLESTFASQPMLGKRRVRELRAEFVPSGNARAAAVFELAFDQLVSEGLIEERSTPQHVRGEDAVLIENCLTASGAALLELLLVGRTPDSG